ncbi:c-type cytochrome [Massilia sp. CF038]|uniref:c-type cytochrome n=1 Tax=Massilia sp. CF038 TaxID=1881045 RepID=UPI00091EAD94|nr:c-type cytochrome [Massilia sp. CF038]SHG64979.1 Cytochrome c553 [Massilia sp. CF038]
MNPYLERLLFSCLLGASAAAANAAELPAPRMAERSAACVACHGKQGQASSDGLFPRIAGKPQAYLYQQLLSFRDGRRVHAQMSYLLAPLSDAYLNDMASWFADQHVPYPAPAPVKVTPQVLAHGRQLVMQGDPSRQIPACVACHGQQLSGVLPGTPGLLGLPRDYLNLQFGAWRTGVRRAAAPDCMAQVASRLTPDEVTAVAAWLASQPVPAAYAPASAHLAPLPLECGSAK